MLSVGSAYDVAPNYKRFIHRFIPLSDYGLDDHTDPKHAAVCVCVRACVRACVCVVCV